jgi:hypothetical protein
MEPGRVSYHELLVLRLIQARFGSRNSIADVFFTPTADACIAAADPAGVMRILLNLTMLGRWYRSGALSLDELRAWIASAQGNDPAPATGRP